MANTNSKKISKPKKSAKPTANTKPAKSFQKTKFYHFFQKIGQAITRFFKKLRDKYRKFRGKPVNPHRSFKRSYREDYVRQTETPGLLYHAATTFSILKKHWKTFLPLLLLMTGLYVFLVGIMSEDFYQQYQTSIDETSAELNAGKIGNFGKAGLLLLSTVTTGGLDSGMDEVSTVFMIILFLIMWLVTIFILRHYFAGNKIRLRDALYNALSPLLSTLLILGLAMIEAIPIVLVVITYSAAVATGFLATPFYALVYFIFVLAMLLLSGYMLSGTIIALIAVTAPGVYPLKAITSAADLIVGRRVRFIIRIIYLLVVCAFIYLVVMLPIILLDLWLKSSFEWIASWPIVPFFLLLTTCFAIIYGTTYLYRYYRWLLDYTEK